jgi:hypothetical protein
VQTTIEPTIITWFPPLGYLGTDEDAERICKAERYARKYWQGEKWSRQYPDRKAHIKAYLKAYDEARNQTPERKAYDEARNQTPERKAYMKDYIRAYQRSRRAVIKGRACWWPRREELWKA